jgi:hypothetical protein
LEGFDDSFDTMKAIAEYFRDLAADDRYFGAEPPTPDAEMLARIAEREIARRVEAHEDSGKIVLRAEETAGLAFVEPSVDAEPETTPAEPEETVADAVEQVVEEAIVEEADVPEPQVEEAAVAETLDAETAEDNIAATVEAQVADAAEAPEETETVETEIVEDVVEIIETTEEVVDAAPESLTEEVADVEQDKPEEVASEDAPEDDDDSVAARLRRIRSVVAKGAGDFEPAGFSEDEHAQDFLADTVADLDAALLADDITDEAAPDGVDPAEIDAGDDALANVAKEMSDFDDSDTLDDEDVAIQNLQEDTLAQLLADSVPDEEIEPEESLEAQLDEPEERLEVLEGDIADDSEEDAEQSQLRARVIKMKRSDFEAAVADGELEETFDILEEEPADDILEEEPADEADSILSPEDEAELQSELDAVEAELRDVEDDVDLSGLDLEQEETPEAAANRAKSRLLTDAEDQQMSRLFDQTESQLDAPESSRRRSAIQHLRAAVEANAAEKDAGSRLRPETDEDPYRSDLASVVGASLDDEAYEDLEDVADTDDAEEVAPRPRARRPLEARPAPLKLVAEQRIDTPREPVRPRRVSAAQAVEPEDISHDAESFREFAEDIGAANLSELLEAAAAYMSDVEGRVQFSRPMLMGKLKEATAEEFSREDSLISFGQLLRNGKLQKLKGGRFAVTDETDFRVKDRDAG